MKLGELKPAKGSTHSKKRVGRGHGSGLGRNAGRGDKGYHSRSGSKHRPWFEGGQMPLHRRVPKRGFSNFLFKKEYQIVNISDLDKIESELSNPKSWFENVVRIHSSGDFINQNYLNMWCNIAKKFPHFKFYAYTKVNNILDFSN